MTDIIVPAEAVADVQPDMTQTEPEVVNELPTPIEEVILWNQTENNMSAGVAILNKDQMQIAVYTTAKLPKNIRPEMAPGLTIIKPGEGHLFKIKSTQAVDIKAQEEKTEEPKPAEAAQ